MIATGSIGAAVQGLGACSTTGDELTELLAGITGTEVVSAGAPAVASQHFLKQCYSLSLQQREECIPSLVSTPGFRCPTPGASVAFCLGLEKSRWLGWVEGHCSWVPFSCQMMCKSGGGGAAVRLLGCSHTPLPHPLASFLELKADSWGWVVA